jgi:hypothetical protein
MNIDYRVRNSIYCTPASRALSAAQLLNGPSHARLTQTLPTSLRFSRQRHDTSQDSRHNCIYARNHSRNLLLGHFNNNTLSDFLSLSYSSLIQPPQARLNTYFFFLNGFHKGNILMKKSRATA